MTHPAETAVIVSMMSDDEEVIAAALLHDVIEDAGITEEKMCIRDSAYSCQDSIFSGDCRTRCKR